MGLNVLTSTRKEPLFARFGEGIGIFGVSNCKFHCELEKKVHGSREASLEQFEVRHFP